MQLRMTRRPTVDLRRVALAIAVVLLIALPAAHGQLIIAHRGASYAAPENTLAAFRLAWRENADGIEGDFYLSADGHIVCIHDKNTKRTAGVSMDVARSTLAQLRRLDVGSYKGKQWAGERIATLGEVLATVPRGKRIYIEVKCGPEIVPPLKRLLARSKLAAGQTKVICFDKRVITAVKSQIPQIQAFWLTGYKKKTLGGYKPSHKQVLASLQATKADGLGTQANLSVIDVKLVRALRAARLEFHAWTVNDAKVAARLAALGVDSITTNRPGELRRRLQAPLSGGR